MKNDLMVLFEESVGLALASYIEENQVLNTQALWGFVREQIEKCKHLDGLVIQKLIAVPPNSWAELADYGRFQRRYSDLNWGYDSFNNEPPELSELYEVFLVAEEAWMLRCKFKKLRVSVDHLQGLPVNKTLRDFLGGSTKPIRY
jgi:hypothetical protein